MIDLSPATNQLLGAFRFLLPIAILVAILKSSWFKGVAGEFIVNVLAKFFLNKDKYHLIKNVTLPTEDGTTQIDHIIVSKYGVFVVETKNMKGWIFGSSHQRTWTQKIYKHTNKFQNPLHQNYKHIETLKSALGLDDTQVHSVIVFVGDSTFKTQMPENVTYGFGYIRFIKSKSTHVIPDWEIQGLVDKVQDGRLKNSFKTKRDHVNHVRDIVREKQNREVCPKCGSSMVVREVKKGPNRGKRFLGCSGFPRCRATTEIS